MNEVHEIGWAVNQLWNGDRVRRAGWNGKGMWLFLVRDWYISAPAPPEKWDATGVLPFVLMRTGNGPIVPWLCSQTDLLAIDWQLVE